MEEQVIQTKKPRAKYEWIVIAVLLAASIVIAFGIYTKRDEAKKGRLLLAELANIRSAVTMYKTLNKANPPSLEALTKLNYSFEPGQPAKPYLESIKISPKGEAVDPFGSSYKYDASSGWVASGSKGYDKW
jgi:type II secretory pathway pseudopilin PulG